MTAKNIVIVGATSAIAEHCARIWLNGMPRQLTLIGRDVPRLDRVAADLGVRSPQTEIRVVKGEFVSPDGIQAVVDGVMAQALANGPVDTVLIAHGSLPEQEHCQDDLAACHAALLVNGVSPVLYAEAFAGHMVRAGQGTIALIGSVAGDRGRKSNYVYGAAKGMVTRYAQGLQHRLAGTAVRIVLIKPGPTDTPMTAQLKQRGAALAPVDQVARQIVEAMRRARPVAYVPSKWRLIMLVIQHLPARIFNRLNI